MSNCLEATQFFLSPCCELSHIGLLYGYFVQLVGTLSCLNWICYQECWGRLWVLAGVEGTTVDVSRGGGDDHGEKDLAGKCFSFLLLSTGSGHPILCPGHTKLCIVRKWWPCISLRLPPAISVNSIFVWLPPSGCSPFQPGATLHSLVNTRRLIYHAESFVSSPVRLRNCWRRNCSLYLSSQHSICMALALLNA